MATSTVSSDSIKIHPRFLNLACRFWPALRHRSNERQVIGTGEVLAFLYAAPFALAGLIWLVFETNLKWLQEDWGIFLIFAALVVIFYQLQFFMIVELRQNRYGSASGAMNGIPLWAGVFIFGPTIFWLSVIWDFYQFFTRWLRLNSDTARWEQIRGLMMNLASETLVPLIAFTAYQHLGGPFPLTELTASAITSAIVLFSINFLLYAIFWTPYLAYHTWAQQTLTGSREIQPILKFFLLAIGLPQLANPFAILAAGLFAQNGFWVSLYFIGGMVMVAYLARRLSWSVERSRQSFRLLEKLEVLGRAIINAPPETENLHELLQTHITNMFPAGRLAVWIFPEDVLAQQPVDWQPDLEKIWPWLLDRTVGEVFLAREPLPWEGGDTQHNPVVVAPIMEMESSQTFGGIYLELHTLAQPWNKKALKNLCPAVQALTSQIASALNQAKGYQQALELQRVNQELKLAGNIQASLLPSSFPDMPGWQFAVTLDPVGETSGDFFDIIPLEGGRIGFVIADVLDKGLGPALYMTLSRTLIRTYATEFDLQPDLVFFSTNERILKDTRANLFVTVFYAVLDLNTGELTYSNAGHNPPYLVSSQNGCDPVPLEKTGLPIGIDEEATWEHRSVQIYPGDVLVFYTDGVPDAQNLEGQFYRQESLVRVINENLGHTAEELQKSILDSLYNFVGDADPFDDITLMVLVRDLE